MIGRADIEGSKSNVAMNAWLPQASYPCDVPPQPNSPPDNVLRPDRPPERVLGLKRRVITPPPIHGLPKEPFPVRPPADTRRFALATLAAQAARQQSMGSELGPPSPALRANPFPEV
ncbi:unnamed protein product, partial [Brassica napus]